VIANYSSGILGIHLSADGDEIRVSSL
jgi:hypothetical protein